MGECVFRMHLRVMNALKCKYVTSTTSLIIETMNTHVHTQYTINTQMNDLRHITASLHNPTFSSIEYYFYSVASMISSLLEWDFYGIYTTILKSERVSRTLKKPILRGKYQKYRNASHRVRRNSSTYHTNSVLCTIQSIQMKI